MNEIAAAIYILSLSIIGMGIYIGAKIESLSMELMFIRGELEECNFKLYNLLNKIKR